MRILHLIPKLTGGGAERQLSYLSAELAARGHEVHVAYHLVVPEKTICRDYERAGTAMHRLPCAGNYDPRLLTNLLRLVRRIRPDLIQSWILQSDVLAAVVARCSGVPWVMREPNWPGAEAQWGIKSRLRATMAGWADAIVANSRIGLEYWKRRFPEKPAYVIRNGFPVEQIATGRACRGALPWPCTPDMRYLLFVGRLHPQKNITALIDAVPRLPSDVKLVLCGIGPLESKCRTQIAALRLGNRIAMLGETPKEQVWALMRNAHSLALVSHYEGLPNVLVEAMLNRCPVVVSDIPPHREILDDGTAHFVNKEDAADIARGIRLALQRSDENADRVGRAFRVASDFSIPRMSDGYEKLYDRLLSRQARSIHDEEQGPHHRLFGVDRFRGVHLFRFARLRGTRRR